MEWVKCSNNHYFDKDTYPTCPTCGEAPIPITVSEKKKAGGWFRMRRKEDPSPLEETSKPEENAKYPSYSSVPGNNGTKVPKRTGTGPSSAGPDNSAPERKDVFVDVSSKDKNRLVPNTTAISGYLNKTPDTAGAGGKGGAARSGETEYIPSAENTEDVRHAPSSGGTGGQAAKGAAASSKRRPSTLQFLVNNASANQQGATMSYFRSLTDETKGSPSGEEAAEPVVGWIVCVKGKNIGKSFGIFSGRNTLGRAENNRVSISGDQNVSREKHAVVIYEPLKRKFYVGPGESSGLTYLNGEFLMEMKELNPRDTIGLGESSFLFVPLCGEDFSWETYLKPGQEKA